MAQLCAGRGACVHRMHSTVTLLQEEPWWPWGRRWAEAGGDGAGVKGSL